VKLVTSEVQIPHLQITGTGTTKKPYKKPRYPREDRAMPLYNFTTDVAVIYQVASTTSLHIPPVAVVARLNVVE